MKFIKLTIAKDENQLYINVNNIVSINENQKDYIWLRSENSEKLTHKEFIGTEICFVGNNNNIIVKESFEEIKEQINNL
jgi:competence transcription factor ComK